MAADEAGAAGDQHAHHGLVAHARTTVHRAAPSVNGRAAASHPLKRFDNARARILPSPSMKQSTTIALWIIAVVLLAMFGMFYEGGLTVAVLVCGPLTLASAALCRK